MTKIDAVESEKPFEEVEQKIAVEVKVVETSVEADKK